MGVQKFLLLISLLVTGLSCDLKKTKRKVLLVQESGAIEVVSAEPVIVRVQNEKSSKLMSLSLKYFGTKGLEESVKEHKDAIQNLVISVLFDYELKELSTKKGKEKFQNSILTSLNEFVEADQFTKVNILNLKEI